MGYPETARMYPGSFEYFVPRSLEEALGLLASYGEEAKLLAGGQSLLPLMKLRLARPRWLIDIGRLGGLVYVQEADTGLRVGALTSHQSVLESALIRRKFPLIGDAVGVLGDRQVRNWGTVGGALAEADPAGDWGPVALALNARIRCASPRGERILDAGTFFLDAYTTRLDHDELIAAAGLTPMAARDAASFLIGKEIEPKIVEEAADQVGAAAEPLEDIRGSKEYKRAALKSIFKQAVAIALRRAQGEIVQGGHVA